MISSLATDAPYGEFRTREFRAAEDLPIPPSPGKLERDADRLLAFIRRMPYARRTLLLQARAKRSLARYLRTSYHTLGDRC